MGSRRPPCPDCGGYLIPDHDLLQNGETIRVIRCVNCGWRLIPPPLVTEPSRDLTHYSQKEPSYMVNGEYSENTRLGICSNCHREIPLVANHRCKFCSNRKDNLEEAARIVEAWIEAGKPVHLGAFAKWRWKPVEEIGLTVRASRTDSPAPMV